MYWQAIAEGQDTCRLGNVTTKLRAYISRLGFTGSDQQKKVGVLSGGERNRLHLARMLKSGANVILLDEPTNDLDVNTIRAMEEALENFAGCAVVVSHDRWFLDRLATHILAFEGDSQVVWYEGNFQAYEEDKKKRLGHDADQPHRVGGPRADNRRGHHSRRPKHSRRSRRRLVPTQSAPAGENREGCGGRDGPGRRHRLSRGGVHDSRAAVVGADIWMNVT